MEPTAKKWYLSKTLWTNFIFGVVVTAVPTAKDHLSPDVVAGVFTLANIILRLITKDKLELLP